MLNLISLGRFILSSIACDSSKSLAAILMIGFDIPHNFLHSDHHFFGSVFLHPFRSF